MKTLLQQMLKKALRFFSRIYNDMATPLLSYVFRLFWPPKYTRGIFFSIGTVVIFVLLYFAFGVTHIELMVYSQKKLHSFLLIKLVGISKNC